MLWWDSFEALNSFSLWMRIAAVGFSILAAIATLLSITAGRRAEVLSRAEDKRLRQELAHTSESAREANRRLEVEQQAKKEAEERRRTPPKFDAVLEPGGIGKFRVRITSHNLIPFEFKYVITTKNGRLVSGFPLEAVKLFPTAERNVFVDDVDIELAKVVDRYLEFSFDFKSFSADELNLPEHVGRLLRKYIVSADGASLEEIRAVAE